MSREQTMKPDQERLSEQARKALELLDFLCQDSLEVPLSHVDDPTCRGDITDAFRELRGLIDSLARQLTEAERRIAELESQSSYGPGGRWTELRERLAEGERENGRLREIARYWLIGEYLASGRGQLSDEEADQAIDAALEDSGSGDEPSAEYVKQMGEVEDVSWATKLSRKMLPGGSGEEEAGG